MIAGILIEMCFSRLSIVCKINIPSTNANNSPMMDGITYNDQTFPQKASINLMEKENLPIGTSQLTGLSEQHTQDSSNEWMELGSGFGTWFGIFRLRRMIFNAALDLHRDVVFG
ncbi:MAG: hypothetical protein ACYCOU_00765 [Sulfobacillus sp.]